MTPSRPQKTARHPLLLAALLGGVGCSQLGTEVGLLADLAQAEARWESRRPDRYTYAVERICFCFAQAIGPVRMVVQGDSIVDLVYVGTGSPVPAEYAHLYPTVDGLFEVLRDALERGAHEVRATYDPARGVPMELWIDYQEFMADEELGMRVTEAVSGWSVPQ